MLTESHWPADTSEEVLETTVGGVLRRAAEEVPDRLALVDGQADPAARRSWTFAELLAESELAARALLGRFEPGERVAIWAANCPEWIILQQGAALAGLILVTVNPALREAEVKHVLAQAEVAGIVLAKEYRGFNKAAAIAAIHAELPALREIIRLDELDDFLASAPRDFEFPAVSPDDPAQIQYTSGTTGFPKAALLHHRGVVNASRFVAERAGVEDGVVWINSMPMFHIGGGALTELGAYTHRGTYVLLPGFDPALQLELVEAYRGTIMLAVPTMLIAMLDHPDAATRDLSSLEAVMSGAAIVPADLVRRTKSELGCRFTIVFGQTEMHGVISQTALTDTPEDQAETIGAPLAHAEVRIADVATGETQPVDVPGEICVRGYQTMLGYYGHPEDTAAAIDADGWLHSGDLGAMDERGYLRITGRLKDVIIRGGENVYPREVEDVLFAHPAISQVTVIGQPDAHWGEIVVAVMLPVEGAGPLLADDLREWCFQRMARFKAPSAWYVVDEFPVTPTGKVQKFVLQQQLADGKLVAVATSLAANDGHRASARR